MAIKSHYRDNFGRWQKTVTVNIKKKLLQDAEQLKADLEQEIAGQLREVHKANVEASFYPRSQKGQEIAEYNKKQKQKEREDEKQYGIVSRLGRKKVYYRHTGTLLRAIDTKIEKKSRYESRVIIVVKPLAYPEDHKREKEVTAVDVYNWLREGTPGSSEKYWFTNSKGLRPSVHNYPTPIHPFESHTSLQMKGYINSLDVAKLYKTKAKLYKAKRRNK